MNEILAAIVTVLTPLIPVLIPGIALLARPNTQKQSLLITFPQIIAISLTSHTLGLFLSVWLGVPVIIFGSLLLSITILFLIRWRTYVNIIFTWQLLSFLTPLLLVYLLFAIPYLTQQDGLPTGDVQKAIFWATEINSTNHLPDYSRSIAHLNRDPVDFYTPGLHALTAYLLKLSPYPFISIGLFAILIGSLMGGLTLSYLKLLFSHSKALVYLFGPFLLLTNFRFLRYLREPGYHFQNLVGELFLFLFLFFCLQHLKRPQKNLSHLSLIFLTGASLVISHQFSAFIAAFTSIPLLVILIFQHRFTLRSLLQRPLAPILSTLFVIGGVVLTVSLGLHSKLPHIFNYQAHLLSLTPNGTDYPILLGTIFIFLSLIGTLLLLHSAFKQKNPIHVAFLSVAFVLLLLSQGPRLAIDIPAVRALFYAVFPLSILAAYATERLWLLADPLKTSSRIFLRALLLVIIFTTSYSSLTSAYATSDSTIRTNSTLTASEVILIDHLATTDLTQSILVDDYNQRSASWLILSQKPTFSRLASDLERIMQEAHQSPERYQLYLHHLDYEKIFSLSSRSVIAHLLQKNTISHLTAIKSNNSGGFAHNDTLTASLEGDQIQLFTPNFTSPLPSCPQNSSCHWLLKASTIANDIGDSEDTFAHLPASLRSTRLSPPLASNSTTYRQTSAPLIPLAFNIGDYVSILWDQDEDYLPDSNLELLLELRQPSKTPLYITTPSQKRYPVTPNQPLHLPANELPISDQGFITLLLENPEAQSLEIDLIALGLTRVP